MALHGCLRALKYVVFALNFFIWLGGLIVLGFAVFILVDPHTISYIQAGFPVDSLDYDLLCYLLIAAGGLMTFVGFLGCCGAYQESRCMMGTFMGFGIVILAMELGGCVWGLSQQAKIKSSVSDTLKEFIVHNYTEGNLLKNRPVDHVQIQLECCGATGLGDWRNSSWYASVHSAHSDIFPKSCCRYSNRRAQGYYDLPMCVFRHTGDTARPWPKGCGELLADLYEEKWLILCWMALGLSAAQVLSLCFSVALFCGMCRLNGGGYKT